jgi:hypothetical protein
VEVKAHLGGESLRHAGVNWALAIAASAAAALDSSRSAGNDAVSVTNIDEPFEEPRLRRKPHAGRGASEQRGARRATLLCYRRSTRSTILISHR